MIIKNSKSKKAMLLLLVIVLVATIIIFILFAKYYNDTQVTELIDSPTEISVGSVEDIENLTIDDVNDIGGYITTYQSKTEIPKEIKGRFTSQKILDQEDAATALLSLRNLFGITEYSFYCEDINEGDEISILLHQLHNGIPVDGGYFRIVTSKNGQAVSVKGTFIEVSDVETNPKISYEDGKKSIDLESNTHIKSAQLVICAMNDITPVLCWKYETKAQDPIDSKLIYVNAINGNIEMEIPTAIS